LKYELSDLIKFNPKSVSVTFEHEIRTDHISVETIELNGKFLEHLPFLFKDFKSKGKEFREITEIQQTANKQRNPGSGAIAPPPVR